MVWDLSLRRINGSSKLLTNILFFSVSGNILQDLQVVKDYYFVSENLYNLLIIMYAILEMLNEISGIYTDRD